MPPTPRKRAASPVKPISTRDRIIKSSIALFNKRGLQMVAIEHIATDMGISPGNLTYHFKQKNDLISASLSVLREHLQQALAQAKKTTSAEESAASLILIYRAFWDFRFYFNALTFLLSNHAQMRKEYFEFRDQSLQLIVDSLDQLHARGFFRAVVPPNTHRLLAENMWSQWLDWLRMQQIKNPTARTPALYDCALAHWSLSQPFLDPQFSIELLEAFQRMLLKKK